MSLFLSRVLRHAHANVPSKTKSTHKLLLTRLQATHAPFIAIHHHHQSSRTLSTESINYSGGQANSGQGGYYGSGGARAVAEASSVGDITQEQRSKMIAQQSDLHVIQICMDKLEELEHLLYLDHEQNGGKVTDKSEELRGNIKRLVSSPDFTESLDRLEIKGSPVWGLTSEEHEMVALAREKFHTC
jgi:hypothetical protein